VEEGVTVASVLRFQAASVDSAEFYTPEADGFTADGDAALSQKIFNITEAEIEAIVEPYSTGNNIGRESVALVC